MQKQFLVVQKCNALPAYRDGCAARPSTGREYDEVRKIRGGR